MAPKKIHLGRNLTVTIVYFSSGHASLKRGGIFHWIATFDTTKTILISVNEKQI